MDSEEKNGVELPCIGIIMLDTQFPRIPGDIGNPETFAPPVLYQVVTGASPQRIVFGADTSMIQPFIEAGESLIRQGADIITTSCGFLALFHRELTQALDVPVFSSSLLQVPLARSVVGTEGRVGILTAHKHALTPKHLACVGVDEKAVAIAGLENYQEFPEVFIQGKQTLNSDICGREMQAATVKLVEKNPDIRAIILECTNMPPYAAKVHTASGGLPVFDIVTLINYARSSLNF